MDHRPSLKGKYGDGSVHDIKLRNTDKKLGQGDRLARIIMAIAQLGEQYDGFFNEDGTELVDMWFEDTFGRRHRLKRAKKYLRTMQKMA